MDVQTARNRVIAGGISDELVSVFRCVAEATSLEGEPKFTDKAIAGLQRRIVTRRYQTIVFRLCHLINAADACGRGRERYEHLFYEANPAYARNFRTAFDTRIAAGGWRRPGFERTGDGIAIAYSDGTVEIPFSEMPVLSALFELLMCADLYGAADEIFDHMLAEPSSATSIQTAANDLQRAIYAWLSPLLPSVQDSAKFSRIVAFLKQRDEQRIEIDDQVILQFWLDHSTQNGEEGVSFRLYRTALDAFINFIRVIQLAEARAGLDDPASFGSDDGRGEIDMDRLEEVLGEPGEWVSPLDLLEDDELVHIKFLTEKEKRDLGLLCAMGPLVLEFTLSVLRGDCFGYQQSRVRQAVRDNRSDDVTALVGCADSITYEQRRARYGKLLAGLLKVMKATAHVLLSQAGAPDAGNAVPLHRMDPEALLEVSMRTQIEIDPGDLEAAREEARSAYDRINRQGFKEDKIDDPKTLLAFKMGGDAIMAVVDLIERYLGALDRIDTHDPDVDGWYSSDRTEFSQQFVCIYGEQT